MSERWPGGIISQTAPVPSGSYATSTAPGVWTLEQQAYWARLGQWPIPGNFPPNIEDVFSTWLYTGNGSSQTITNGIDLAGKGGLVWIKNRGASANHQLVDTVRGRFYGLATNNTDSENGQGFNGGSFLSTGFSVSEPGANINVNTNTYCSWSFREQAKFFDIVTYTGNGGSGGRTISHNLGSAPGMIILKVTNLAGDDWYVYHRSIPNSVLALNSTNGTGSPPTPPQFAFGNGTTTVAPTSTNFTIGSTLNGNTYTYVAYLFAHNAGGFGAAGTDNVISCGSYTGNGSATGPTVNLGYEPQYILIKGDINAGQWVVFDNMRGIPTGGSDPYLRPNSDAAEATGLGNAVDLNATGFQIQTSSGQLNNSGTTYIYMAIRRGPMATPTIGTSVFYPTTYTETVAQGTAYTGGFPVDSLFTKTRNAAFSTAVFDRLRGTTTADNNILFTALTDAETDYGIASWNFANNTGVNIGELSNNTPGRTDVIYQFRRAPGFFDEVCYTGTGASRTLTHNLTVVPELIIIKSRSGAYSWSIGSLFTSSNFVYNTLETTDAGQTFTYAAGVVFNGQPSASSVFLNSSGGTNGSGDTFVMYLFATIAGVSKVGSYTGTGSAQTINAGLPTGARFVLIKRTDSTGSWWVWDTARGMVTSTDPRLALNSTAAEINNDWVYTTTNGFQIVTTDATVNASGGSYIYLAIA